MAAKVATIQNMGPLRDLVEKLPFAGQLFPEGAEVDGGQLRRIEAMILSMTPEERTRPEIIDDSRSRRIARGSGSKVEDLGDLLKRFQAMRQMLGQLGAGGGGLLGKIPGLGKLLSGGGPDLGGLDPSALGLGEGSNRRMARAMKSQARREKRKSKRKHMRRSRRR